MTESTEHLLVGCNFTKAAWNLVVDKFALPRYNVLSGSRGPEQWVYIYIYIMISEGSKKEKKKRLCMLCTF
jgi:hypothetical protein